MVSASHSSLAVHIDPARLGSAQYRADHGLRYAYVAGAMVKAIASEALVERMARAGLMSYFGTGGLGLDRVESAIVALKNRLPPSAPYGMNLLCNTLRPELEDETVELFLRHGVGRIEASAFTHITSSLVRFRLAHIERLGDEYRAKNRVLAKLSRPEVAQQFLKPAPEHLVRKLLERGLLTESQARLSATIPMADDICVESDSGGHTDKRVASTLLPSILRLRDEVGRAFAPAQRVRVGAGGGIGTPEAAAATFVLGADFVLTGSINQCTVEAGTSDAVKDLLVQADVQDTEMAPAGDMFEIGARVQVLKRGLFFPARANKLYDLYRMHDGLDDIPPATLKNLEEKLFEASLAEVSVQTRDYLSRCAPEEVQRFDSNPKIRMARVFQWYFAKTNRAAIEGRSEDKLNFQIHCGPAMGACNAWLRGTPHQSWRERHVDALGEMIMRGAAEILSQRLASLLAPAEPSARRLASWALVS